MTVTVTPDDAKGAGYALIRVPGAASVSDPAFRIARPPGWPDPNLGPSGWQGTEASLVPDDLRREGTDLVLSVGPAVCSRLDEDTYYFTLPAAALTAPVAWPAIEEVHGGFSQFFERAKQPPEADPGPSNGTVHMPAEFPVKPVDGPPPLPPRPPPRPPGGKLPLLLGLAAVLLLLAGGGTWWWLHRPKSVPVPDNGGTAQVAPPPDHPPPQDDHVAPPPPIAAPNFDAMSVPDLVAKNDPQLMLDQARKRLPAKPGDSMLLLEAAGEDRHFGPALTELARLYDPSMPRRGGIKPDLRQAAKYYRDAEQNNDHSGHDDRERLRRNLLQLENSGNLGAKLIQRDYWP